MSSDQTPEYELTWTQFPTYIHFKVVGTDSPAALSAYARDMIREARTMGIKYALVEDKLSGPPMTSLELFEALPKTSELANSAFDALAVVNKQVREMAYFTETVGVNRGLNISVFTSVEEAATWLLDQIDDGPQQREIE